jgi:type I restriction enzyme M protein
MNLTNSVRRIQDVMRKDTGLDGDAQRLGQLVWMLFLKIYDYHHSNKQRSRETLSNIIPEELRWSSWASFNSKLTGDELIDFIDNRLFPTLRTFSTYSNPSSKLIGTVFEDVHNYMRSGYLLRQVAEILDLDFDLSNSNNRQLIGDFYETLLASLQNAGNAGEYYTPRPITKFVVQQVNPKLGEALLDYACGTGGFLISALEHMREKQVRSASDEKLAVTKLFGVEKKPFPHLLCVINLLLHGVDEPVTITRGNMLDRPLYQYGDLDKVDVIVTNPPFGGIEEDRIKYNFPEHLRSKETTDLFLVLLVNLLRDGGRAGIVVPDGILFGGGVKTRIRELLLKSCDVHTILRLPRGVFNPYTGIATNIIFLTKGGPTENVWFFEHPLPNGQPTYSRTKPIQLKEFELERSWWANRVECENAWRVTIDDIKSRDFNLDFRNPLQAPTRKPSANYLSKHHKLAKRVNKKIASLKALLSSNFGSHSGKGSYLILKNLDMLCSSPAFVEILRKTILKLAIRGRLAKPTKQNSFELLNEITSLRQKQKHFSYFPTNNDTQNKIRNPFHVPPNWSWVRVDEVAEVVGGGTPRSSDSNNFAERGIPWITPADLYGINSKYISHGRRFLSESGLANSSAKILPQGAVLFSSRAPIGYVALAANQIATNQGFKSLVPYLMGMNEYLYYFLKASADDIERQAPGTTFKEASGSFMKKLPVPIPPLAEQRKIVSILDKITGELDEIEVGNKQLILEEERLCNVLCKYALV